MYLKLKKILEAGFPIAAITLETTNEVKIFMTILVFLASFFSQAQNDSSIKIAPLSELSLDELMNITVINSSSSEQKIRESPSTSL